MVPKPYWIDLLFTKNEIYASGGQRGRVPLGTPVYLFAEGVTVPEAPKLHPQGTKWDCIRDASLCPSETSRKIFKLIRSK